MVPEHARLPQQRARAGEGASVARGRASTPLTQYGQRGPGLLVRVDQHSNQPRGWALQRHPPCYCYSGGSNFPTRVYPLLHTGHVSPPQVNTTPGVTALAQRGFDGTDLGWTAYRRFRRTHWDCLCSLLYPNVSVLTRWRSPLAPSARICQISAHLSHPDRHPWCPMGGSREQRQAHTTGQHVERNETLHVHRSGHC